MNTNCLTGIQCPTCAQEDAFDITATTRARVVDNGVESAVDYEWTDDSAITCVSCGTEGTVREFSLA